MDPISARVAYVGHSTVRLDLGRTSLLTDPLLRDRFMHVTRRVPSPVAADVGRVDAVLISHLHADHLDFPSLRRLGPEVRLIAPLGARRLLGRRGFRRLTELRAGESTEIGDVEVRATPAAHDGRRWPLGPAVAALGYEVRQGPRRIYFAGDTDRFEEMSELAGVQVALLPIGGWGPRLGPGHLNPERAAEVAAIIRPRMVIPIHWGTYLRLGLTARRPALFSRPPRELAAALGRLAPDVELRVLQPGESVELPRSV